METTKIIFTNGCFDILHVGHIRLLKFCKNLGGKVVVGLNSDASIKALKGNKRPINSENERKELLEALKCVDEVIIFNEQTPYELIKKIKPNIIVKGGDYKKEEVIGNDLAEVILYDFHVGFSTTNIIKKINS